MSDEVDHRLADISEALANATFTVVNNGFDDKHEVICSANYSDGTNAVFQVTPILEKGITLTVPLKIGVTVSSFTVYCTYDSQRRQCGRNVATSRQGYHRCFLSWAVSGSYEEVLAFGS